MLLQEHHLDRIATRDHAKGVEFWQGEAFWNSGIPMGRSQKIRAGTAILVDRSTAPHIVGHGILVEGRAQYITLHPSQSVEERGGRTEASPSVRKLSDHSPLSFSIWGSHQATPGKRPQYFDLSILGEESGRKAMLEAWTGVHPPPPTPESMASTGRPG